jgi:mono/diheme cytochrome c family protein
MLRTIGCCIAVLLVGASGLDARGQESSSAPAPPVASPYRAAMDRYCVTCHNEKLKTAGLMLDKMDVENVPAGAQVWEKVIRKLRAGAMPPAGAPRPDKDTYDSFASYLETAIDRAAAAHLNPGRPAAVHRLNRTEYANAIRDLLALQIDGASLLPADDTGSGFDNNGDVLIVSPPLMERYMSAAEKISRLAIGDPGIRPIVETYDLPEDLDQQDRVSEDLPLGSRGGIAMSHYFPLDGQYDIKIRLKRTSADAVSGAEIYGITEQRQLDVRLDGVRIKLFKLGGERKGRTETFYVQQSSDEVVSERKAERRLQVEYETSADDGLEMRIPVKAGAHLLGVTFLKDTVKADSEGREGESAGVGSVTIGGPYDAKGSGDTPSRHNIFVCRPGGAQDQVSCAKKILSALARRAYRRPVADGDVQPLLTLYNAGRSRGEFETGIEMALRGILVSPGFLFRVERDPANVAPDSAYRISDIELASRLSFFIWASIPDGELLDLAERGKLKDSAVLEQQVRRMLADSRSKALVDNFTGQWLYLRNLRTKVPDPGVFPDFDENLREAFQRETELFLDSIVHEDRSVVDLLGANYTFVNERLAKFYGIPNVYGSQFRRVTLTNEARGGLLGQASVLTVTSYNSRTSPVLRGKWVLQNILGTPPPPPPPNVPSLKDDKDAKTLTMRQRMEQHRANPACAVCHRVMDPIGFALENFDAIGRFRATSGDSKVPIDVSGALPDGTKFEGPSELRKLLLSHREQFVETMTEKLLTYALGRGVEYYDMPAVREILRSAAPSDYSWSSLVLGIVKSPAFQMRRSQQAPSMAAALR